MNALKVGFLEFTKTGKQVFWSDDCCGCAGSLSPDEVQTIIAFLSEPGKSQ